MIVALGARIGVHPRQRCAERADPIDAAVQEMRVDAGELRIDRVDVVAGSEPEAGERRRREIARRVEVTTCTGPACAARLAPEVMPGMV